MSTAHAQGIDTGDLPTSIEAVASTVRRRRPDLRQHAARDGTVTLLFGGMTGVTPMKERSGERVANTVIQVQNAIVRKQVAVHGGFEVELQGDAFLFAFANALQAIWCAIGIQRATAAYNAAHAEGAIRVCIGLHAGGAISDAHRFFDTTLIVAARIAAHAVAGEILVSSALKDLVDGATDAGILPGQCLHLAGARDVELKGLAGRYTVYSVVWGAQG